MLTTLPFKIIVDSRNAVMGTSNKFSISLPETLHVDKDVAMYVNSASVSNTFLPVGTNIGKKNHYFYWFERLVNVDTVFNRAALPERAYVAEELAGALQTAINNASWFGDNQYSCTFNEETQTITVSRPFDGERSFFIPSNTLLSQPAFQAQTNPMTVGSEAYTIVWRDPQSALGLFGLDHGTSANLDLSALLQLLAQPGLYTSQVTGAIDIRRVHNVYIHSTALSNNNVLGTDGGRTTLVKIPVLGQMGDVLHRYHSGHAYDFVDVSNKTMATLDFEVKDGRGDPLDLRGGTVSIELLFASRPI